MGKMYWICCLALLVLWAAGYLLQVGGLFQQGLLVLFGALLFGSMIARTKPNPS